MAAPVTLNIQRTQNYNNYSGKVEIFKVNKFNNHLAVDTVDRSIITDGKLITLVQIAWDEMQRLLVHEPDPARRPLEESETMHSHFNFRTGHKGDVRSDAQWKYTTTITTPYVYYLAATESSLGAGQIVRLEPLE
jgi:hypothetical protein